MGTGRRRSEDEKQKTGEVKRGEGAKEEWGKRAQNGAYGILMEKLVFGRPMS